MEAKSNEMKIKKGRSFCIMFQGAIIGLMIGAALAAIIMTKSCISDESEDVTNRVRRAVWRPRIRPRTRPVVPLDNTPADEMSSIEVAKVLTNHFRVLSEYHEMRSICVKIREWKIDNIGRTRRSIVEEIDEDESKFGKLYDILDNYKEVLKKYGEMIRVCRKIEKWHDDSLPPF